MSFFNNDIRKPSNPDEPIWRYMDFTKYVSLLDTRSLYFSRADLLGDPFEGSQPHLSLRRGSTAQELAEKTQFPSNDTSLFRIAINTFLMGVSATVSVENIRLRLEHYISCWHMNSRESAAMWDLYSNTGKGISIRSTYGKLKKSVPKGTKIGIVEYIDYKTYKETPSPMKTFFLKRQSFSHEHEIRAVIQNENGNNKTNGNPDEGIHQPINLKQLIDGIYVAPFAPDWMLDLVRSVAVKLGGLNPDIVTRSEMEEDPLF